MSSMPCRTYPPPPGTRCQPLHYSYKHMSLRYQPKHHINSHTNPRCTLQYYISCIFCNERFRSWLYKSAIAGFFDDSHFTKLLSCKLQTNHNPFYKYYSHTNLIQQPLHLSTLHVVVEQHSKHMLNF